VTPQTVEAGKTTPAERRHIVSMSAAVAALLIIGWGGLALAVAAGGASREAGFGVGLGWTVFVLGMRHAFDADHIAAIDNVTRSLAASGRRPLSVGFWFSLGHSTVVFVACAALAAGVRFIATTMSGDSATLRSTFSLVGTSVSAVFLLALGVINLIALVGLLSAYWAKAGADVIEQSLNQRGLIARLLGGRLAKIAQPWHIYPVGLLFGLGFDTATEVGLFAISGGVATLTLPWYAVLTLPVIFASGMALFDTLDGIMMGHAYSWAGANSARRRLVFNITVTGLSVLLALLIGTVEAMSLLRDHLGWTTGVVGAVGGVNLASLGYVAVAAFAAAWVIALLVMRRDRRGDGVVDEAVATAQ